MSMKTLNPFDRLKKWNDVPVSLFPCSKVTRTSMPIGRAVPLYTIEMMQGNHIKLDCSQLTRFMSMTAPVMQNYEVVFGAFYCPYVALDDYTDSNKVYSSWKTASMANYALRARQFFNPDTDNSLRVYPLSISYAARAAQSYSGSLFDHLQYRVYSDLDISTAVGLWETDDSGTNYSSKLANLSVFSYDSESCHFCIGDPNSSVPCRASKLNMVDGDVWAMKISSTKYCAPFGVWLASKFCDGSVKTLADTMINAGVQNTSAYYVSTIMHDSAADLFFEHMNYYASAWFTDVEDSYPTGRSWRDVFGDTKQATIINEYFEYVRGCTASINYGSAVNSSVPWLVYHRIYADWFLPENFIDYEDYIAMIGSAYNHRIANANATMKSAFTPASTAASGNQWLYQTSRQGAMICRDTFAEYCRKGECMPVLWSKDQFTGLQPNQQAQATPLGSSIEEHLYQRMVAKFKDLINRIGHDYRHNTAALYGSSVNDSTLLRSQVIGYKSFDIQIGDVAQTSKSDKDSTLGDFAGYAVSRDSAGSFEWTAEENGMIMVLAWVRPKYTAITTTIPRYMLKKDYGDYLNPLFGGVGRQPVTYAQFNQTGGLTDSNVLGWQERYFEYMMVDNECSGAMRNIYRNYNADRTLPTDPTSLTNLTNLKFLYMTEQDDLNRVFVDQLTDPVLISAFFEGNVTRQLPSSVRTDF